MKKKLLTAFCLTAITSTAFGLGMVAASANETANAAPSITFEEGASVRLHETEYGIRFRAEIENYNENYTYGMYVFPADYLDYGVYASTEGTVKDKLDAVVAEINQTNGANVSLAGGDCTTYEEGGAYKMNGALTGLKYSNLNREFAAVAYYNDGANTVYSEISDERNIVYVAGATFDEEDFEEVYDEADEAILDEFVKLGYLEAMGKTEEEAATVEEIPTVIVSLGEDVEIYNYLQQTAPVSYVDGEGNVLNGKWGFNPYTVWAIEGIVYENGILKAGAAGTGSIVATGKYLTGDTLNVTVRAFDETLDEAYFGDYETVEVTGSSANLVLKENGIALNGSATSKAYLLNAEGYHEIDAEYYVASETGVKISKEYLATVGVDETFVTLDETSAYFTTARMLSDKELTDKSNVEFFWGVSMNTNSKSYDETENALKVSIDLSRDDTTNRGPDTMLGSTNYWTSIARAYVDFLGQDAYALKLSYKGTEDYVSHSIPAMKVWAGISATNNGTAIGLYQVSTEWQETYILLSAFENANAAWEMLKITTGGAEGSALYLKTEFVSEADYNAVQATKLKNPTSKENVSLWTGVNTTVSYDETEGAMKLTRTASNDTNADQGVDTRLTSNSHKVYIAKTNIDAYTNADETAYAIKISYKGDEAFATASAPAFKVWAETACNVAMSKAAASTVYASTVWSDTFIPLADFATANADWQYLVMGLGGVANSSLFLKVTYVTEAEYKTYKNENWAKNLLTISGLSNWIAYNTTVGEGISLGGTSTSMTVTLLGPNGVINGRWYAASFAVDNLKELYTAGYKTMSFSISYDGEADGARGIRIYDHMNENGVCAGGISVGADKSGITVTQDAIIAQTNVPQTVTVDIGAFLASGYPRIGIVFNGAQGCTFTLSNLQLAK